VALICYSCKAKAATVATNCIPTRTVTVKCLFMEHETSSAFRRAQRQWRQMQCFCPPAYFP